MARIMRRLRAGVMAGWLMWSGLAAAGQTIVFWNNQQASDIVTSICKEFTRKNGIAVDVSWIAQADYRASLLRHGLDGDLPDVALVPADFLSLDQELTLSRITPDIQTARLLPNPVEAGMYGDEMLGAPVTWGNHLMLFYNRDLVKKPARTFAELEAQAPEFRARGVKPLGMNFGEMYWLAPFIGAYGGWPINDRGQLWLRTPATVQALEFYFDLVHKGLTLKECRADCSSDRFARGEFAYAIAGDWMYRDVLDKMGPKLGVTTIPAIGDRVVTPMFSAYVLIFPNRSLSGPKREALIKFIRFMQSPEIQRRWANEGKLFPVTEKGFKEMTAKADENLLGSLAQLKLARPMPNARRMAFAWEGMAKGFSAMYNGRLTAVEAASVMQTHAERVAKRAGE